MECEAAAGSVATEATVEIVLADAAPAEACAARPAQEAEDNMTVFADSEDECRDCDTEGTTDEEGGQQAMDLALHFARIRAMGLLVPPLPQPLQESRRQFLRRVKKNKKKSWKRRQGLACKSRAALPTETVGHLGRGVETGSGGSGFGAFGGCSVSLLIASDHPSPRRRW